MNGIRQNLYADYVLRYPSIADQVIAGPGQGRSRGLNGLKQGLEVSTTTTKLVTANRISTSVVLLKKNCTVVHYIGACRNGCNLQIHNVMYTVIQWNFLIKIQVLILTV